MALRGELLAAGWTSDEVRRSRRRGELTAVRRGAFVDRADPRLAERRAAHRLRVEAVVRQLGPGAVVSHVSAAVLFGLPCWDLPLERVHVTRDRSSGARRARDVHVHAAALPVDDVTVVDGPAVTTPARTVVDIARSAGFEQAVAVADAALAKPDRDTPPLTTPMELSEALLRATRRPGAGDARRAVAFADGLSGGVGESRSRVAMAAAGVPAPVLQWDVRGVSGMFLGRVDFAWPQHHTVGEFDGKIKYGRLLRPGQAPGDVVYAEKLREDAIRDEGWAVVRWTWSDLTRFDTTVARLRRTLDPS